MSDMNKKQLLFAAALIAAAGHCGAQSLNKEITVERDIVPEYRDADRLRISPLVSLPQAVRQNLSYSFIDRPVGVTPAISPLGLSAPVAQYSELFPGYAAIGYMPMYNLAASAGYRFINSESTRLGAWLQYNGKAYHSDMLLGGDYVPQIKHILRRHTATVGADLRQSTGRNSRLDARIDYTFARYNIPINNSWDAVAGERLRNQSVNDINVAADWHNIDREGLTYGIGAAYSRFAFMHGNQYEYYGILETIPAARQNRFVLNGDASVALSKESWLGLDVEFSNLRGNTVNTDPPAGDVYPATYSPVNINTWLLRFTPAYHLAGDVTALDLGVKIDLSHGSGKAFHIAPDVRFSYTPLSYFNFTATAGGGEVQNPLSDLYAVMPYMEQIATYRNSHIPFTLDASFTIGPFKGVSLELFGGYARANDWLMPASFYGGRLAPVNVRGWHGGAAVAYSHGKLLKARLSAETARSDKNDAGKGYYMWRDRARYVVEGSLRVNPMEKLGITAGYSFRGQRKAGEHYSLGNVSNMSLGADYALTSQFSVFLNGENLFNRKFYFIGGIPSQGITGLAGVTYKF
jgi:hypothetical protein